MPDRVLVPMGGDKSMAASRSVSLAKQAAAEVQSLIGNAQVCDDVALPPVSSTDQVTALLPKLLGIATRTTHRGLLPLGTSPQ